MFCESSLFIFRASAFVVALLYTRRASKAAEKDAMLGSPLTKVLNKSVNLHGKGSIKHNIWHIGVVCMGYPDHPSPTLQATTLLILMACC